MDSKVQNSAKAALHAFKKVNSGFDEKGFFVETETVFNSEVAYLVKVNNMDEVFDNHPEIEELREVFFDLLLINFFSQDVQKLEEDYLDSAEWEAIEEKTLDRGTELLNLLLYLRECKDEEIDPTLDDYLREFLLVDEDEFQDEYRIYEEVIANQILVDDTFEEIEKAASSLHADCEMKELFYPVMAFFSNQNPSESELDEFLKFSQEKGFDNAVYSLLIEYNKS